ncbi:MAG TPA: threonine synthase [Xanthomonadales bacterium]|nr:threonine synthase [Xanthomonadales bacterium]
MDLINIKHPQERVSFRRAVLTGLGRDQGLYFPRHFESMDDIPGLLELDFVPRSAAILQHLTQGEVAEKTMSAMVASAFDFPVRLTTLDDRERALELFHGPSLAFKDFGARFMARCLAEFHAGGPMTILTATSGDTGAAVAQAYHGQPGIEVVVLYPRGRISPLQEKLFCTLGGNVHTVAVEGDFDTCQSLVKQAFDDEELKRGLGLNSANSINIARLLAQVCYYFEAAKGAMQVENLVFSVPSGNFGNVTAGLMAQAIGLPYKRIIAATNANDTVPRFLASGHWDPRVTVATITNAMDIASPNNFPRILELDWRHGLPLERLLSSFPLDDDETRSAIRSLWQRGYLADPHSALAWAALNRSLQAGEEGVFLCTAHPAKFLEVMEKTLGIKISLPPELQAVQDKEILSSTIPGKFKSLRKYLLEQK